MPTLQLHGVTIPLDSPVAEATRAYMRRSGFASHEAQAVYRLLEKDDVVLELGTGCGFLAVYCAQRCARVVTVEADERMKSTIDSVFDANAHSLDGHVTQHFGAVTRKGERRRVHAADDFWTTHTTEIDAKKPGPEVEGLALSDLLDVYSPSVLVIDIEGGEVELVGEPLPAHVRAVVIQTHTLFEHAKDCPVYAWLTAEGFTRDADGPPSCGTWRRTVNETAQP